MPKRLSLFLAVLMLLAGGALQRTCRADEPKFDFGFNEKEDPVKDAIREGGPGDSKEFSIKTDDNISNLKIGDVYTNGAKTYFTVDSVTADGTSGGIFRVKRTAGTGMPDRKLNRVSSVKEDAPGPPTIVARQTLLDLYIAGGPFLHPIAVLGFCTIILALNSLWIYRRKRQCPQAFIDQGEELLKKGDIQGFQSLTMVTPGLLPRVCRAMVDRYESSTPQEIEKRCEITASAGINRLRTPVKALNLIAAAAPLLGLLGTIVGMVIVFEAVASSTGAAKAQALAAGIRVKLFSTAGALCVAIPALFLYFAFNTKLGTIIAHTELQCERFLHQISVLKRKEKAAKRRASEESEATA